MKRIYLYIVALLVFVSCQKEPQESQPPTHLGGYVTFSTGVETKTPMNMNMREKDFGVVAFSYTSSWEAYRSSNSPDFFHNQMVSCDQNGICIYDIDSNNTGNQVKQWDLSKLYSFFAYYPMSNHDQISISEESKVDVPLVKYIYPFGTPDAQGNVNITVPSNVNLVDLMTASSTDQTGKGTGNVKFNFEHRLFCFEIIANNYNDDVKDSNGNITESAAIDIKNLKLKIEGLEYDSMVVPMTPSETITEKEKEETWTKNAPSSVTYILSDASTTATIPSFNNGGTSFSLSENCSATKDGYLMLIPQESEITGTFTWDNMPSGDDVTTTFTTNLDFKAGNKYSIAINFAGDAITIAIIEEGAWLPQPVYIEFE